MASLKNFFIPAVILFCLTKSVTAQSPANTTNQHSPQSVQKLTIKQQSLAAISALAGKGDLKRLHAAFNEGLNTGWTINELKEAMVQLYAYAGFPRSLNGLSTLQTVVNERAGKGLNDVLGKEPDLLPTGKTKLEAGTELQTKLLGRVMKTSVADFAPIIDVFLKEHLFWDIFGRNNLDFQTRELITISTLAGLGNAEAQLRSHLGVSVYNGITEGELHNWVTVMQTKVGGKEGKAANDILQTVLKQRQNNGANGMTANKTEETVRNNNTGMIVRISEIEINRSDLAAYKAILKEEAEASVRLEPGVVSIFPMYKKEDSTQVRILEIYASREAYESHLKTPHFLRYKTTTQNMVKSLQLVDMDAIDAASMTKIFAKLEE